MVVIWHFVFLVLEEGLDEEKRSITLKSWMIIKMKIKIKTKKKRKTQPHVIDLCPQTSTKKPLQQTSRQNNQTDRFVKFYIKRHIFGDSSCTIKEERD
ncbi:hypothetical protein HanIR_Chr04g0206941 [Helianthus annuus]|nr:hypothetical protein HanIR_Chr04g0206941 [Helianthus annuus]